MVDLYMKKGNACYFETAYMYHKRKSEIAIKKCLVHRYPRNSYYLCDKMPIRMMKKNDSYEEIFAEQLEKCGVDYFDVYLLHNLGEKIYNNRISKNGGFEFLQRIKREGKARFIGFSFHDRAEVLDRILTEHPEVDVVQLQINYLDWESPSIQSKLCYEVAKKHGKPVIVMEPIKGGNLINNLPKEAKEIISKHKDGFFSPASMALKWVAQLENVKLILSGMGTSSQVIENLVALDHPDVFDQKDNKMLEDILLIIHEQRQIDCTVCKYCADVCKKNIPIWDIFSLLNTETKNGKRINEMGRMLYLRACNEKGLASDCIGCGLCEDVCSQRLEIRKHLKTAVEILEKK